MGSSRVEKSQFSFCLSLLVLAKILERLLYDGMFFPKQNQPGFKRGDSCGNQLLPIKHQIYKSFNYGHEVRSVFLDMLNAFDSMA